MSGMAFISFHAPPPTVVMGPTCRMCHVAGSSPIAVRLGALHREITAEFLTSREPASEPSAFTFHWPFQGSSMRRWRCRNGHLLHEQEARADAKLSSPRTRNA